jgi:hypothetical protein
MGESDWAAYATECAWYHVIQFESLIAVHRATAVRAGCAIPERGKGSSARLLVRVPESCLRCCLACTCRHGHALDEQTGMFQFPCDCAPDPRFKVYGRVPSKCCQA